ncbi:MAG TPA: Gldg family protein [Arenimonas sp.]|uniref:GldG family protein n=1 Tax=Arenimonas sp. TaxID=1872635 RepID=UPI002D7F9FA6|nr:Gldg family protein [Arenimonas sp.]HEU0151825.1 Gldg family protein [Arenimonas sp.]
MKILSRRSAPLFALALLALGFVALVALNSVLLRGARLDLTDKGLYTLSEGTRHLLGRVDEPVRLKLYYSEHATRDLQQFRVFATRVRELLEEVAARSDGQVTLEVIDPEPFSEAEDQAEAHGLQSIPLGTSGDKLYFGLVGLNSTDGETVMPFIQPDKEAFLEYDVAKLISTLSIDTQPVVAIISGLPTGPTLDPAGRSRPGWVFDRQLSELFELRRLQDNPTAIADDVDLLMLVHPRQLSADTLYAIDQFVMRGGRLLAFVDPDSEADESAIDPLDPLSVAIPRSSDLPALFKAWGIQYDPTRLVLDDKHALQVQPDPNGLPVRHLAVLGLGKDALNQDDVVTGELQTLNVSSAGALGLSRESGLAMEALAQSSGASALADVATVRDAAADPEQLRKGFRPGGQPHVIAARFTGPLRSAFPDRAGDKHVAESREPVNLVIVADTDVLADRMWVQVNDFLGQPVYNAFASNGDFVYNAVDNLVGNADLIAVRTRASAARPFERVTALRRSAEQRYRSSEQRLQRQLDELEQKLAALQQPGADGQAQPLSGPQQAEILRFQDEKLRMRKELREVQHRLNADIEALGDRLKLVNILGMPALVVLVALGLAWRRRARRRATEA